MAIKITGPGDHKRPSDAMVHHQEKLVEAITKSVDKTLKKSGLAKHEALGVVIGSLTTSLITCMVASMTPRLRRDIIDTLPALLEQHENFYENDNKTH